MIFVILAEDNTLSIADISIDQIINGLECDIDILQTWFQNNGIFLFFYAFFVQATHAESINSYLQRGMDRRLRHTQQ